MRILVASDIHGRLSRMKMLDEKIRAFQPDKIFLLGDFLYHGPRNGVPEDYDPMAVGEILKNHKDKIIAVRGNCDARIDEDILSFPLEDNRRFALGGYWFDLYHGDEFSLENLKPEIGDILISGHTHIQILEKKDGYLYLNPGSPSFPKGGNEPSYATIDGEVVTIRRLSDGSPIRSLKLDGQPSP